jgi:hypothetical protein
MQYLLLIYFDPAIYAAMSPAESQAAIDAYWQLDAEAKAAGVWLGSNALHGHELSTTLYVRDGEPIVSDGPFAESKEVLGGYYHVEVPGLREARFWAAKIPDASRGVIEIRPIVDFEPPA